jgi:hypothetical protein
LLGVAASLLFMRPDIGWGALLLVPIKGAKAFKPSNRKAIVYTQWLRLLKYTFLSVTEC